MRLLLPTGVSTEQVPVDRFCRKSLSLQVEVWVSGAHLEIVADFVAFWADIWMCSCPLLVYHWSAFGVWMTVFIINHLSS